jgi:hypothetical protein
MAKTVVTDIKDLEDKGPKEVTVYDWMMIVASVALALAIAMVLVELREYKFFGP